MQIPLAYHGHSGITRTPGGLAVALAPNLHRDRVSFAGQLRDPLAFREAVSALHDVVVTDLRFQPKDKSAYEAYLKDMARRDANLRKAAREFTRDQALAEFPQARREQIQSRFNELRNVYWSARRKYTNHLREHDAELFRLIVPLDPIVTVAPDAVLLECFSADESLYGCLSVDRSAFTTASDVTEGTTNVDYSWRLYEHFQELRSYRATQFRIDPTGVDVQTAAGAVREEKIDLPPSWLRGFMQIQSALCLPTRRVHLSREGLYNILSYLKRHRARTSPRALRYELVPGRPVTIVLEPFEQKIVLHDQRYLGTRAETIRTWGRDRLQVLARVLPLVESAEVLLLGTGLPSFFVLKMGALRLTVGLSGWTKNDWTGPSALDQLLPPVEPSVKLLADLGTAFRGRSAWPLAALRTQVGGSAGGVVAGLNRLALLGQVIHDVPANVYRWRQALPIALSQDELQSENPETEAASELVRKQRVKITRDEQTPTGLRALTGTAPERPTEVVLNCDQQIVRGKCTCSYFYQFSLRRGPCRHMQAIRTVALQGAAPASVEQWYEQLAG